MRDATVRPATAADVPGLVDLGRYDDRPVLWKHYLRPGAQGHGLGKQLLGKVVAAAADEELWLEVFTANRRAIGFYRSQGFEDAPGDPPEPVRGNPRIWMRRRP